MGILDLAAAVAVVRAAPAVVLVAAAAVVVLGLQRYAVVQVGRRPGWIVLMVCARARDVRTAQQRADRWDTYAISIVQHIIGHARTKYVGKFLSCMVISGRFILHATYAYAFTAWKGRASGHC